MHHRATDDLRVNEYDAYLDDGRRREIRKAAAELDDLRVAHVNSTASGGGVAEVVQSGRRLPYLPSAAVVQVRVVLVDAQVVSRSVVHAPSRGSCSQPTRITVRLAGPVVFR